MWLPTNSNVTEKSLQTIRKEMREAREAKETREMRDDVIKKIRKEMTDLNHDGSMNSKISEKIDSFSWTVKFTGPENSPYEGRKYLVHVAFPEDYPDNPPLVTLKNFIFHPNIVGDTVSCPHFSRTPAQKGRIGLDILAKENWFNGFTICDVIRRLESLMRIADPREDFVVNEEASTLYWKNWREYERRARRVQ